MFQQDGITGAMAYEHNMVGYTKMIPLSVSALPSEVIDFHKAASFGWVQFREPCLLGYKARASLGEVTGCRPCAEKTKFVSCVIVDVLIYLLCGQQ